MRLKKFNELNEDVYEQSDNEILADKYHVRDFTIKGIDKLDDEEVVFVGYDFGSELSYLTINFNNKTIKMEKE
jgi:hypothetical protein